MLLKELLKSSRIELRSLGKSDANGPYLSWMNDQEILQYLETEKQTEFSLLKYIEMMNQSSDSLLLGVYSSGTHIGNIKLGPIDKYKSASVGIIIGDKSSWGKGFASEAIGLISRFALNNGLVEKLTAGCYENNIGSLKAFEKAGYQIEGKKRKQIILNDKRLDCYMMGLIKEDLKS